MAERYFAQVELWNSKDQLQTFAAANEAFKAMPFDARYRIQLLLSLGGLLVTNQNAKVTSDAADKAYRYAASASPHQPSVLIARAQYLINSGRWEDGLKDIAETLGRSARKHPQSWIIIAYHEALSGRQDRAAQALAQGLAVGGKIGDMRRAAKVLHMEIEER